MWASAASCDFLSNLIYLTAKSSLMRKPCLTDSPNLTDDVNWPMAGDVITCSSCRKVNEPDARYCISCGRVLKPVYCSACGTVNPVGLEQCLECGNYLPALTGIRWNPIVTVLQPTSAMTNETVAQASPDSIIETEETTQESEEGVLSRFRRKLGLR